jgi:predicted MFS family arabinose efflux permease
VVWCPGILASLMPPSRPSDAVAAPPPRGSILILGFVGFVTAFGAHIVAVNLPVYAEQVGVGVAIIGLLIAIYDLAEIVAKPLFGALADRRGMKQTMLAGILVFTMASLAYPWIDPRFLVLIRFVQGVGAAAFSAVSLALVGAYAPHRRGRAYGLYNAIKGTVRPRCSAPRGLDPRGHRHRDSVDEHGRPDQQPREAGAT